MTVSVSSKIENKNYVRVNLGDDIAPRYYIVDETKADEFVKEFKKQSKKTSIITNTSFFGSLFVGTVLTAFGSKNVKNDFLRYTINCAGGLAAGIASYIITGKYALNKQSVIEQKYNVTKAK